MLDNNGQPLIRAYNGARLDDRAIDEMIGICRGIISDEMVNQKEAVFLKRWMEANLVYTEDIMAHKIYRRIKEMLVDRVLDQNERVELLALIRMFTGDGSPGEIAKNLSSKLPLDIPPPIVEFRDKTFCFTGAFAFGSRKMCQEVVVERGGIIKTSVSPLVDYLVLGYFGSTDWVHTTYGRKIENAMQLKKQHKTIKIISEDHWTDHAFGQVSA